MSALRRRRALNSSARPRVFGQSVARKGGVGAASLASSKVTISPPRFTARELCFSHRGARAFTAICHRTRAQNPATESPAPRCIIDRSAPSAPSRAAKIPSHNQAVSGPRRLRFHVRGRPHRFSMWTVNDYCPAVLAGPRVTAQRAWPPRRSLSISRILARLARRLG